MVPSFIVIDKPDGLTSHDVIQHVRQASAIRQVGHTGTLDPFATGLLIILLGKATRLTQYLHALPKTYEATLTLGATSDTDDVTGVITDVTSAPIPSLAEIKKVLKSFLGKQSQIPPIYSAIKTSGQKLYDLARSGKIAEALKIAGERPREIEIYSLELLKFAYPNLELRIHCSTGTYIRSLARDIGLALHTRAYVSLLRRTAIGHLNINQAVKLKKIEQGILPSLLRPVEELLSFLPGITFSLENVAKLKQGNVVVGEQSVPPAQPLALFDENKKLLGIGMYDTEKKSTSPQTILF